MVKLQPNPEIPCLIQQPEESENSQLSEFQISPKKTDFKLFLGENSQISRSKNPSGHLSPVIQRKKDKSGRIVEYPKVYGERVPLDLAWEYPHQFFWLYNWSVKDSDGRWKNKSKSVPRSRIWTVRNAIATNQPVAKILNLIQQP